MSSSCIPLAILPVQAWPWDRAYTPSTGTLWKSHVKEWEQIAWNIIQQTTVGFPHILDFFSIHFSFHSRIAEEV